MQIDKKFRPELCAGKPKDKDGRDWLHHPWHVGGSRRIVATNGHMLVVVPTAASESKETFPIPVGVFKDGRKLLPKDADIMEVLKSDDMLRLSNGAALPIPETDVDAFPDYTKVLTDYDSADPDVVEVTVNAEYLLALQRAMGVEAKMGVTLQFKVEMETDDDGKVVSRGASLGAISVTPNGAEDRQAFGVLMPIRAPAAPIHTTPDEPAKKAFDDIDKEDEAPPPPRRMRRRRVQRNPPGSTEAQ